MPTFASVLHQSYQDEPERTALTLLYNQQPDQALTYRALLEGAAGWAQTLAQAGVGPGQVVILLMEHGTDLTLAYWGAVLRGAIPSILPYLTEKLAPEPYRQSLHALFGISAPAAVVTFPSFAEEVRAAAHGTPVGTVLLSGAAAPLSCPDFSDYELFAGFERQEQDIVLLQHSSGTTGLQKGVALSHGAVFRQLDAYAQTLALRPTDTIVSWLPLYHDMGLIAGFLMPLLRRVPLALLSPFDWVRAPARLFQAITRFRGSLCWLPNFAYNFCAQKIRARELEGVDLASMRAFINCSEPLHQDSHRRFQERFTPYGLPPFALATCYAMAENVFAVTQSSVGQAAALDQVDRLALQTANRAQPSQDPTHSVLLLSSGRPLPNTRVRILDEYGHDLPERQVGEIALSSDCMLTGYYQRPDLTEQAFRQGWYITGDLGYLAEGELYVTGRKKDLIIVGGKNIYPQDLEQLAGEVPGIIPGRVVAFGLFNEETGTEDPVIVAESLAGDSETEALADVIRRQVTQGSAVALRRVQVVERGWLLKTSSGKIARSANREKYVSQFVGEESDEGL